MTDSLKPPPPQPPYLMAALICDDTLEERDGRLTILRITTDVNVAIEGTNPPQTMPEVPVRITVLITFNAGGKPGNYDLQMNVIDPSGKERAGTHNPIELRHDNFTMNTIAKLQINAKEVGVYWIVVLLDTREVTRIPLTVNYSWKKVDETKPDASSEQSPKQTTH